MLDLLKGEKTDAMLNRQEKFIENYSVGQLIGEGTFGEVRVCTNLRSK